MKDTALSYGSELRSVHDLVVLRSAFNLHNGYRILSATTTRPSPLGSHRRATRVIEPLPTPTQQDSPRARVQVFVIEDEDPIRRLIRDTLEGEGFGVQTARSAEDALTMLAQTDPSVILLDLRLPGMDGFAFLEAYRARRDGAGLPPVIIVSALRPRETLPEGVVDYLRKPFDLDDLIARVERSMTGE